MVVIRLSPGAGLQQGQVGDEGASIREIRHHTEAPINSAFQTVRGAEVLMATVPGGWFPQGNLQKAVFDLKKQASPLTLTTYAF